MLLHLEIGTIVPYFTCALVVLLQLTVAPIQVSQHTIQKQRSVLLKSMDALMGHEPPLVKLRLL